jgi:hypothetical protein
MTPESVLFDAERLLDDYEKEGLIQAMQASQEEYGSPRPGKVKFMTTKLIEKYKDTPSARNYLKRFIDTAAKGSAETLVQNPLNKERLKINAEGEVVSVSADGVETAL